MHLHIYSFIYLYILKSFLVLHNSHLKPKHSKHNYTSDRYMIVSEFCYYTNHPLFPPLDHVIT